jgi:hypothetical protein
MKKLIFVLLFVPLISFSQKILLVKGMKFTAPDGFVINPQIENTFINQNGEMIAVAVLEHNKFKLYDDENKKLRNIRTIVPLIPTGISSTFKIENKTKDVVGYTSSVQSENNSVYGYAIHYFLDNKIIQVMSYYVNKESARNNLLNLAVNNKKLKQYVQKDTSVSINKNSSGIAFKSFKGDLIYCLENIASISPNQEAVDALKKILLLTDENDDYKNYYIIPCDGVSNFMAFNYEGKKIVLYNDFFVNLLFAKLKLSNNKWLHSLILFALAHEIGHFEHDHAYKVVDGKLTTKIKLGDKKRKLELEADEYAGYIMAKDGKSLTELLRSIKMGFKFYHKILDLLPNKPIVKTHPPLDLRVESITKGWNKFEKQNKKNQETHNIKLSNDIKFNVPKGFKKTDDLRWSDGNNLIIIQYTESNDSEDTYEYRKGQREDTQNTSYLYSKDYSYGGKKYDIQVNYGEKNGMIISTVSVYRNGLMYIVTIGVSPLLDIGETDEEIMLETINKLFEFTSYMIASINLS